jgi:hypothetical protein
MHVDSCKVADLESLCLPVAELNWMKVQSKELSACISQVEKFYSGLTASNRYMELLKQERQRQSSEGTQKGRGYLFVQIQK